MIGCFAIGCLTLAVASTVAAQDAPAWRLAARPALEIGGGAGPHELTGVRAVFRLADGRVVVANGATSELRVFTAAGSPAGTFGRRGAGPGEFERIGWVGRVADTILVYDPAQKRVTQVRFAPRPSLGAITRLLATSDRGPYGVAGRIRDGSWVVTTGVIPRIDAPPGVHRLRESVGLVAAGGTGSVRWLGEFPSMAVFVHSPSGRIKDASVGAIGFGPALAVAAMGAAVWLGDTATDSLLRYDPPFEAPLAVRLPLQRRRPTPPLIQAALADELASARRERDRAFAKARFQPPNLLPYLPTFERLVAGASGELVVQAFAGRTQLPATYLVIAGNSIVGKLEVPAGFRIHELGHDYVIGVYRDADGVEYVRQYALYRQASQLPRFRDDRQLSSPRL